MSEPLADAMYDHDGNQHAEHSRQLRDIADQTPPTPKEPSQEELLNNLMALMVAGVIEANNSEDGQLTVEIMQSSKAFKGVKSAINSLTLKQVLSLIGENEPVSNKLTGNNKANYRFIMCRNKLRKELRQSAERIWS